MEENDKSFNEAIVEWQGKICYLKTLRHFITACTPFDDNFKHKSEWVNEIYRIRRSLLKDPMLAAIFQNIYDKTIKEISNLNSKNSSDDKNSKILVKEMKDWKNQLLLIDLIEELTPVGFLIPSAEDQKFLETVKQQLGRELLETLEFGVADVILKKLFSEVNGVSDNEYKK